jgi:hypothetical protein
VPGGANGAFRKLQKFLSNVPQDSQAPTGVWKLAEEDPRLRARLEGMLRFAVVLVFAFAIGAALSDLARGRRPLLFG